LGLLTRPTTDSNEKDKLLKSIEDLNALKLRCQRSRYDELEKKHYWKSTPVSIADETNNGAAGTGSNAVDNGDRAQLEGLHHVAPGDDPLSALLLGTNNAPKNSSVANKNVKTEEKERKLFGGGIFGNKDNRGKNQGSKGSFNKSSGSLLSDRNQGNKGSFTKSSGSLLSDSFTSLASSNEGEDEACKGSRWADFYSTREVLDVIEKDLVRLPTNHYTIYHEWRIKNQRWKEHREKDEEWKKQETQKEEDEKEEVMSQSDEKSIQSQPPGVKQSWTLGQSLNFGIRKGVGSVGNLAALLEIGQDDSSGDEEQKRDESSKAEVQTSIKERAGRISQILFVYAREHQEIGYRQGMHEVLSYLLLALEMDLLEQAISNERKSWRRGSLSFGLPSKRTATGPHGGMAGVDSSGNLVVVRLLDENYILHDAFSLFEYIMTALAPAYDVIPAGDEAAAAMLEEAKTERGESPMESMTSSIVSKIRYVARDEQLFGHVLYMPVPPQLYFAKWIRLMFGRELAGGMKSVLRLWDAFFDLASARVSSQDEVPITVALLDVLKTAAASMILLIRHKLLAPTMAPNGTMTGEPDSNIGIGYLMNYTPIEDIGSLVVMISKLLKREQKISSQLLKERQLSQQSLLSESYRISSITEHPFETNDSMNESWDDPLRADPLSSQLIEDVNGLTRVYRTGENSQVQPRKQDVAESLGNIAEGLFDFGSIAASAAIATIQNKYDNRSQAAVYHPLQNNDTPSNQKEGFVIKYRPIDQTPKQRTANVMHMPMGEKLQLPIGENTSERDLIEELINSEDGEDADSVSEDDLDVSFASKLSVSEKIGESIQKSPKELATMLEKSVATLMKHFDERLSTEEEGGPSIGNSQHSSSVIPDEIWDAMADIDLVRKELRTQAANQYDHARSCSSLRSSANSASSTNRRGRKGSWKL